MPHCIRNIVQICKSLCDLPRRKKADLVLQGSVCIVIPLHFGQITAHVAPNLFQAFPQERTARPRVFGRRDLLQHGYDCCIGRDAVLLRLPHKTQRRNIAKPLQRVIQCDRTILILDNAHPVYHLPLYLLFDTDKRDFPHPISRPALLPLEIGKEGALPLFPIVIPCCKSGAAFRFEVCTPGIGDDIAHAAVELPVRSVIKSAAIVNVKFFPRSVQIQFKLAVEHTLLLKNLYKKSANLLTAELYRAMMLLWKR